MASYISINMHIVFATKGRAPTIEPAWRDDFHAYIGGTCRGLGATATAVGGVADHVHLLVGMRATHCVADFVREVKKASSVWASGRNPNFAWQVGYGAFSVSHGDVATVIGYIERQGDHHRNVTSLDEFRALLAEHSVSYDEKYFE